MNYKLMGRFIAQILLVEGAFMVPALLVSLFYGEYNAAVAFFKTLIILLLVVLVLRALCRNAPKGFYAKEGLFCVGLSWIVMGLIGSVPFYLSQEIPDYIDAFFEIVSGFTTTGASILNDVEALTHGMLYWRSFSHWVGGMGVLVFLLAVAPVSGRSDGFAMHILRAESPGPNVGKLVPRMRQTAMILYLIYIGLTIANAIFLLLGDMPLFDAVCTALGTAGTGGFGIKNDSIAGYSPYIQWVTTIFMLLFGVNFSCYYLLLLGKVANVFKDEELRLYLGIIAGSITLITINLWGRFETLEEGLRHVSFQVATVITTTGFATTDFDQWHSFSKSIMFCLMLVGASAGSTGGGFKCGRLLLVFKILKRNIEQVLAPQKIQVVRLNGQAMDEKILSHTNAYLAAYVVIMAVSYIIISLDGFSITTNLSAVVACFNNIGPGFEGVGPTQNYAGFSTLSKFVLIINMLAGRLEIFPILVLFSRNAWRY
ncbi:MAG: TrkH family potassium uptake protein [Eubacteriales bacterium]